MQKNSYFGQPFTFALSLESKTSLQAVRNKLVISRLYFNVETDTIFDLHPRILGTLNNINLIRHVAISPDNKAAFLISNNNAQNTTNTRDLSLHLVNISNYSSPVLTKSFSENINSEHIQISTSQNLLLKRDFDKGIEVFHLTNNMGDLQSIKFIEISNPANFILSADEKAIIVFTNSYLTLEIWSISDLNSIYLIQKMPLPTKGAFGLGEPQAAISSDRKYLFYLVKHFYILELNNSTSNVVSTINLQIRFLKSSFVLSSDEKTLFIIFVRDSGLTTLETYDITNVKSPVHLSSFPLPRSDYDRNIPLTLSPDNRILVIMIDKGLLALDVAKPSSPNNYRFVQIGQDSLQLSSLTFSKDGQSLFISTGSYGFQIIDLKPQYLLMTPTENYKLGKAYSSRLALLQRDSSDKYNPLPENYKFIKFSQYSIDSLSSVDHTDILYPSLPSWMSFDKDNGILTLEPKSQWSIGSYNLYASLSNRISPKSFIGIGSISNETDSKHLLSHLVSQNYIDNKFFLTPDFHPNTELLLDERFSGFQKEISQILGAQIFEVLTQVTVYSSLSLSTFERLSIQTPSPNSLTIALKFHDNHSVCQFANRIYSAVKFTITDNKAYSVLEGPLFEINNILPKILINLESTQICAGSIAVSDGLNPPINVSISNMSSYFTVNQAPTTNSILLLQDQINNVSVLTGQHFIIELDPKTFQDLNNVTLEYELVMQNKHEEKPGWISLRGLSLMGTPPETLYLKSLELAIVVRNEFKAVEVPFTLSIKVSFIYALKLVFMCFGYLFTVYKVWRNYGLIYNIFAKKYYRYPKDYYLSLHQEVNDDVVPPIRFIAEEIRESDIIFENLLVEVRKNPISQSKSIAEYFKNSSSENYEINERMLFSMIKTTVDNLSPHKKQKLKIYLSSNQTRANIINTIIFNKIIFLMLCSEQKTKKIFDKLKTTWTHFVKFSSSKFIINSSKLNQEFPSKFSYSASELSEDTLNSPLLNREGLNITLLSQALLAHAFEHHNMNVKKSSIKIKSKQKIIDSSWWYQLKEFLKMDLHSLKLKNKDEVGFGIKYKFIGNSLHFCGFPHDEIQDEKLLVQIVRSDEKILRELCFIGGDNSSENIEQIQEPL